MYYVLEPVEIRYYVIITSLKTPVRLVNGEMYSIAWAFIYLLLLFEVCVCFVYVWCFCFVVFVSFCFVLRVCVVVHVCVLMFEFLTVCVCMSVRACVRACVCEYCWCQTVTHIKNTLPFEFTLLHVRFLKEWTPWTIKRYAACVLPKTDHPCTGPRATQNASGTPGGNASWSENVKKCASFFICAAGTFCGCGTGFMNPRYIVSAGLVWLLLRYLCTSSTIYFFVCVCVCVCARTWAPRSGL